MLGIDFFLDPFGTKEVRETFEEVMAADVAAKPGVLETQQALLAARYNREVARDLTLSAETAYTWRTPEDRATAEGWWIGLRVRKDF